MAATNTHTNPIIQQVSISGTAYDIHDASAVHSVADLDKLGTGHVFNFAGVVADVTALGALTGMSSGDVYLVEDTKTEYVYLIEEDATEGEWHEFGGMHSHNHTASVSGTNQPSAVTVSVPAKTYSASTTKLSASQAAPTLSKENVLGDGTTVSISGKGLGTVTSKKLDTQVTPTSGDFISSVTVGAAAKAISALNTTTIKNPTVTDVSIPQFTFSDTSASKVTLGTALSASKVTASSKTASKATAATALEASKIITEDKAASKITLGTAFSVPNVTGNTAVTVKSVKTNSDVTATNTSFTVVDGVLTIGNTAVIASKVATEDKTATNTVLGTAFSIPNVTGNTSVTVKSVKTNTDVSIPQYTFADVTASAVSVESVSIPNVTKVENVTSSFATAADPLAASSVTTSNVTVATGTAKSTVDAIPSVTTGTAKALTAVDVTPVLDSTATDAVSIVTGVGNATLSATVNAETISAVTDVTEGKVTIKSGTAGDVSVATGVSSTDTTLSGSGTAAAQTWSGSVTVNNWSDSDQEA